MRSPKHRLTQATLAVAILAAVLVGPTDGHPGSTMMEEFGAGAAPAAADGDDHGLRASHTTRRPRTTVAELCDSWATSLGVRRFASRD